MVSYVLPLAMVEVREYLDRGGRSPFASWSDRLNREAAAKVAAALARIQQGNFSNAKGVGAGVYEYRIDFGPGYRIYFGKDGDRLVIVVGGGTKNRQQEDIKTAWPGGKTTNNEKRQEGDYNGFDTRFQGNNPGARKT
jgi:putative addiction module killer protein